MSEHRPDPERTTRLAEPTATAEATQHARSHPPSQPGGSRFVPGTLLGRRFRIVGLLGRGGMGQVYRAEDLRLGEAVALKLLPPELAADQVALEQLHQEVRLARQVAHPNVCRVFDVGEADGLAFISMELIDGEDLASLLRRIGRLPESKAIEVACQLCAGLAAAHEKGVLHRDLKPANIMIDGRGRARISDFGLATLAAEVSAGELAGTPSYMAPEQLARGEASFRSDVYALGLVLYECLTGRRPFEGTQRSELMSSQRSGPPAEPSKWVSGLDPVVERVVLRCLEPEPRDRPASVLEVAAALPGGDPLAAALAAGETPSPEMVAAAPHSGSMGRRAALGWTAMLVLALPFLWVFGREQLRSVGELARPPVALADRAASLTEGLGLEPAVDQAWGFRLRADYIDRLGEHSGVEQRRVIDAGATSPLRFWYRERDAPILAAGGEAAQDDPPLAAGDVLVELDPAGRLRKLEVWPRATPVAAALPVAAEVWSLLWEHAGLDPASLEVIAPARIAPMYADRLLAWRGSLIADPGAVVRVEAAELGGRPVRFEVVEPFDAEPGSWRPRPPTLLIAFILPIAAFSTLAGLWLARRNLKSGRGDPRGALRLGVVVAAASFGGWLLRANHALAIGEVFTGLDALGNALVAGAYMWLLYLALEPLLRRRWPEALVSWSRLLAGRFNDPLVAREVFVGVVLGVVVRALDGVSVLGARALGEPLDLRYDGWMIPALAGARAGFGEAFDKLAFVPLFNAFGIIILILGLELVLRQRLLAALAVLLFLLPPLLGGGAIWLPLAVLQAALLVAVPARLGLLASAAQWLAFFALLALPPTLDWGAWYGGGSIAIHALLALVTVWVWNRAVVDPATAVVRLGSERRFTRS